MRTLLTAAAILSSSILTMDLALLAQGSNQVQTLLQQLQSAQNTNEAAEKLLKLASADTKVREQVAGQLPAILDKGPQEPAQPWTNAVRLAGELKIAEAAPALAKWIHLNTGTGTLSLSREARLVDYPAGQALVQIGVPAIPALVGVLDSGNLYERWNAAYALNLIGSPQAKTALREHLKREQDPTMRDFIERALR
jgi:HEAT repeat protein